MGARGPTPQPSVIKYVRGNPSKDPLPTDEPTPDLLPANEPAPEWLDDNERAEWDDIVPVLRGMRVFTEADRIAVALMASYMAEIKEAREQVKQYGKDTLFFGPDPSRPGKVRIKHSQPTSWYTRMQNCKKELRAMLREFGMTASSRSAISINAAQSENPLSSHVKRRSNRRRA